MPQVSQTGTKFRNRIKAAALRSLHRSRRFELLMPMRTFEEALAKVTQGEKPDLLGAVGVVFNAQGEYVYEHGAGRQSLSPASRTPNSESTFFLGSAGKLISYIAGLQLVERGLTTLDEPIFSLVPELENSPIISSDETSPQGFKLRRRQKSMTLRHILTHTSGISGSDDPLIEAWQASAPEHKFLGGAPRAESGVGTEIGDRTKALVISEFSWPLLFEPGESWSYGHSVHWLQVVIERASGMHFVEYERKHIFEPLGLKSSAYWARDDLKSRSLQPVQRQSDGTLVPSEDPSIGGLMCSVSDVKTILTDLMSPEPRLLSNESRKLLLSPAFAEGSDALAAFRADLETYGPPAGIPMDRVSPPVNYSMAGLVVQGSLPMSHLPAGTFFWCGFMNSVWAVHPESGIGMLFATQLFPTDDTAVLSVIMEFFKGASRYLQQS